MSPGYISCRITRFQQLLHKGCLLLLLCTLCLFLCISFLPIWVLWLCFIKFLMFISVFISYFFYFFIIFLIFQRMLQSRGLVRRGFTSDSAISARFVCLSSSCPHPPTKEKSSTVPRTKHFRLGEKRTPLVPHTRPKSSFQAHNSRPVLQMDEQWRTGPNL